ncbi:MFS transporter [Micromonospora sp. RP3T]|uniref:MFS transporter n=1 Tax=Micromonospora sp. RP3T TaxID=2135446 RepID=UPI003D73FF9A
MTSDGSSASPRRRDERLLRIAFAISTTGDWVYRFALPLLVLQVTGSSVSAAFTYAVEFVPYLVVGLFSGVVADRVDRRRLLVTCDITAALITAGIATLCLADRPHPALLIAAAFLLSCARPFHFPAFQGFLADRVVPERRAVVNAWVQGIDSSLTLIGPLAGAAVVAVLGPAVASGVNAVSFALSAVVLARTASVFLPGQEQPGFIRAVRQALRHVRPDFLAGLRAVRADDGVFWGTVLLTATNFAMTAVAANLVYVSAGPDGRVSTALVLVFTAEGAGALVAAVLAPALMRRVGTGRLLILAMGGLAVALLVPAASVASPVLASACFVLGAASSLLVVPWRTYRQQVVDTELMGRVVSVQRATSFALNPVGAVMGGWLVGRSGPVALFATAGTIQLVVWLCTWSGPLGRIDGSPRDAKQTDVVGA